MSRIVLTSFGQCGFSENSNSELVLDPCAATLRQKSKPVKSWKTYKCIKQNFKKTKANQKLQKPQQPQVRQLCMFNISSPLVIEICSTSKRTFSAGGAKLRVTVGSSSARMLPSLLPRCGDIWISETRGSRSWACWKTQN